MARIKSTFTYIEDIKKKAAIKNITELLQQKYQKWKSSLDIRDLNDFLDFTWHKKDLIRPKLGIASYNTMRGCALEEFVRDIIVKKVDYKSKGFELFWRKPIVSEELYIFEGDCFKKHPKTKKVDLSLGILEGKVIHPFAVVSCKVWYGADWLDADRDVFDRIRSRYPHVLGYAVCMSCGVKPVSLISAQRTGMKIFQLYNPKKNLFQLDTFLSNLQSAINA